MKDLYTVSDVHGDYEGLRKALYRAGLFDNHGLKDPNAFILQIGDLGNCVRDSIEDDLRCLDMVGVDIDMMLVGNHEIPYFDATNTFGGFFFNKDISNKLHELKDNGLLVASYVRNGTLITHAGVTRQQLNVVEPENAYELNVHLNHFWETNVSHRLFRDCGRARFGPNKIGGMLWCDFDKEFTPTEFPQIVGHTSGTLRTKGNAICIDTQRQNEGVPTVLKVT